MTGIMDLVESVNAIISPAYLVGGAVRDHVMGLEPKDYDFCTPVRPDEIEQRVKAAGRHVNPIGKRYGTIMFKTPVNGTFIPVEVTTFRAEEYREDCRKPDCVFVENLHDDLSRRDFTINAMAIKPNGKLIDPFGGQKDIIDEKGLLRAVGNPTIRFKEDPLRILRLCRFASQFGFAAESNTLDKAEKRSHRILMTSKERWVQEMDKLLLGKEVFHGLQMLAYTGVLRYIIPELWMQWKFDQRSPYHDFSLYTHTSKVVEALPLDIDLRWAGLLHDVAKPFCAVEKGKTFQRRLYSSVWDVRQLNFPKHDMLGGEMADRICGYLKFSKDRRERVVKLVTEHSGDDSPLKVADCGNQKKRD